MKKIIFPLFALAALLTVAGCNTARPGLAGLKAELAKLEIEGATGKATIRYTNPNLIAYNLAQSKHKIHVAGWSGVAETREAFGVPPQAVAEQVVALKPERLEQLAAGAQDYRLESDLTMRLYGESRESMGVTANGRVVVERK
jgi:hypothetical protein